jgi:hypothetical protein
VFTKLIAWGFCVWILLGLVESVSAQGTAFTYQGQLSNTGNPANGSYDLKFSLYYSNNPASPVIFGPITNSAVAVTNGLFTTQLDFGNGVFTGPNYWLGIAVRATGGTGFTALTPFQELTPTPYAIFANTASNLSGTLPSSQLSGAVPSAQISGTYSSAVTFSNNANTFAGAFSGAFNGAFGGAFTGNGSSLSNLNASQLTSGTVADARLSANVPLLNGNQAFSGVNSFTNTGNSFSGSFFGNGLVGWITVPGMTQQAARDTGYMLTSPGLTTVTLPLNSGLLNGDVVRVSGAGTGGWLVAENSGQSVFGNLASYRNCILAALPVQGGDYRGIAASAGGVQMYVVGNGITGVYSSSDAGQNWSSAGTLSGSWFSIACSANGKIVYAEPSNGGTLQMSTNSGSFWFASSYSAAAGTFISCSADGSKVFTTDYACSGNGTYLAKLSGGVITISTNGGSSFNISVTAPASGLNCLAVSSDCSRLVTGASSGLLYISANLGSKWTTLTVTNQYWTSAWMSPDGSKFAATAGNSGSIIGGAFSSVVSPQSGTVSTNSTIGGSQGTAVELQYTGNGQFMPVSSTGTIWAN